MLFALSVTGYAQQKISWPDHKKAVIVLTYDDALDSQLNIAIPQLDSAHLTGTFFLTGGINNVNIARWRAAAAKGFELANHSLYHPCLSTVVKGDPANYSENYTVPRIVREIYTMNSFLNAIDGKTSRTYAYPCTETAVGGVSYVDTLRKSGLIKYARGGGGDDAIVTDFKKVDPLVVPSYGLAAGTTGAQLIAYVKKVQQSGGMGILMFHGIGGDYITTQAAAHRELLKYLADHKSEIWVATFQQAMDYAEQNTKGL